MPHLDPDDLAVTALDPTYATPGDLDHLQGCAACTDEVDSFRAAAARLGGLFSEYPQQPSPGTWDRIAAELDREQYSPGPAAPDNALLDTTALDAPPAPSIGTVTPIRQRSFLQRASLPLAAAAAGLLIGGGAVGWWWSGRSTTDPAAATTVLAVSPLGPVDAVGDGRFGRAELIGTDSGTDLQVNADGLPTVPGDYHQVWLIDPDTLTGDAARMVSLGVLHQGFGTFAVPSSLDLKRYRIVDISDEPDDGNPLHSGNSIARGELP